MSFWIELHCDVMAPNDGKVIRDWPPCHTHNNNNPGVACRTLGPGQKILKALARERGWCKTRRGWECPYCQTQPTKPSRVIK